MQTTRSSIMDYEEQNCRLFHSMQTSYVFGITFQKLYKACNGNVCAECSYKLTGNCGGLGSNQLNNPAKIIKCQKTNKELAKILNCSKRQIAKQRKEGTLPKEYN